MYQEKRPTCVTVIGWAWIVIGCLMCLSASGVLIALVINYSSLQHDPVGPFEPKILLLIATIQIVVAALGVVSGISFLKLKAWSRSALEGGTWLLLLFTLGFPVFFFYQLETINPNDAHPSFLMEGVGMSVVIAMIYGMPLGIMLKYLRGPKVKNAFYGTK